MREREERERVSKRERERANSIPSLTINFLLFFFFLLLLLLVPFPTYLQHLYLPLQYLGQCSELRKKNKRMNNSNNMCVKDGIEGRNKRKGRYIKEYRKRWMKMEVKEYS